MGRVGASVIHVGIVALSLGYLVLQYLALDRGFNPCDEAYYMLAYRNPFEGFFHVHGFGVFVNWLLPASVYGSPYWLRIVRLVAQSISGLLLLYSVICISRTKLSRLTVVALAAAMLIGSNLGFACGPLTLSYNHITGVFITVSFAFFVLGLVYSNGFLFALSFFVLSVQLFIKATSAAGVAAILMAVYFSLPRKAMCNLAFVGYAFAGGLLGLVFSFLTFMPLDLWASNCLNVGFDVFGRPFVQTMIHKSMTLLSDTLSGSLLFVPFFALCFFCESKLWNKSLAWQSVYWVGFMASLLFPVVSGRLYNGGTNYQDKSLFVFYYILVGWLLMLRSRNPGAFSTYGKILIVLYATNLAAAAGSGAPYAFLAYFQGALFFGAGILGYLWSGGGGVVRGCSICLLLMLSGLAASQSLTGTYLYPYGSLAPLTKATVRSQVVPGLYLDEGAERYLLESKRMLEDGGWTVGDPLIIVGDQPAIPFMMNAYVPGDYNCFRIPRRLELALRQASKKNLLPQSHVLFYEKEGLSGLSEFTPALLKAGIDLQGRYVEYGKIEEPYHHGTFVYYRPKDSEKTGSGTCR